LAIVVGCGLTLTGLPFVAPVVGWFQPTAQVADYATTYLRISLLGIPAMLVVLAATGVLRGLQDTRTPLVVSVGGNLANIALNVLLVYGVGLGIAGSALGTVLAQLAAAAIFMRVVVRGARRGGVGLRPDWPGIRASAGAAVPLLLRTLSLRVVLTIATVVATRIGTVAVAAHQVVFGIWSFLAFALDAIAIAGQAIVGRYLGGADVAATRAATRRMIEWGIAAGLVTGLATVAARPVLIPLFTTDSAVRSALEPVLLIAALFQPVAGIVFVLDGVLIGAGDARYLALAGLGTVAVFVPCALAVLAWDLGLTGLWWAMGVFMLSRLAFLSARAYGTHWLVTGATR
jgi:putative MATE family efflux protein